MRDHSESRSSETRMRTDDGSPHERSRKFAAARVIEGTPIFDGERAVRGYALNRMCFSLNERANRDAFLADEDAYCRKYSLNDEQINAVRSRNVQALLSAGGNIYYLAKLAGCFGLNVKDIGAQQTGMSVEAFRAKLRAAAET